MEYRSPCSIGMYDYWGGGERKIRREIRIYLVLANTVRPLSVRRYFWRRLWGFSGIVLSIHPAARHGNKYCLRKCTRSLNPAVF